MEALLGKTAEQATALERYQTFVRVSAQSATRAELMFMLDRPTRTPKSARGDRRCVAGHRCRRKAGTAEDSAALDNFVARLAADGLWIYEAMYQGQLDAGVRARVAERIAGLLAKSDGSPHL